LRPERPKRGEVIERGQLVPLSTSYEVCGSSVSSQRVPGRAQTLNGFVVFYSHQMASPKLFKLIASGAPRDFQKLDALEGFDGNHAESSLDPKMTKHNF